MKTLIIKALSITLLLLPLSIAAQKSKTIALKGNLKNFSSQVIVDDISDMQNLLPPTSERMFVPDEKGNFQITFKAMSPNYYRLGRNILYLSPGDNLVINADYKDSSKAEFTGMGGEANNYLRKTPFPKAGSYIEAGKNAKATAKETVDFILNFAIVKKNELDALKGVTAEFKRLETARIKADTINSLLAGRISFYQPKISKEQLKIYESDYKTMSEAAINSYSKDFVDASLLKIAVYRDVAERLTKFSSKQADIREIEDWAKAYSLVGELRRVDDKAKLKNYSSFISAMKTVRYRNALRQTLDSLLKFGKGDPAVDFTAVDLNGNAINLDKLKGKVIYIDLWATWCGPCMEEMSAFEKLKQKYKDNDNIAFISLSIDENMSIWRKNVGERKADGIQWFISRNKLLDYNVVTIPRTIVIDRSFKVANLNAPVPSSKETSKMIDELLK